VSDIGTYNKLWGEAHEELSSLLTQELPAEPLRPERDRVVFFQRLATLYVRYVQIFRQLEEAYDQVVQPQKRRLIREVLDGAMGRVLELKNEMVEKEFSEYHYMDDVIQDLKLTPEDLEIPIPRYFMSERSKVLRDRSKMLSNMLDLMGVVEKPKVSTVHVEEAVRIIQVTERARQGRLRAKFMREIQRDQERQRKSKDRDLGASTMDQAAVCIQKVWKGFLQRKRTKREREEEMIFLGMAMDQNLPQFCPAALVAEATKTCRRTKQEEHEEDYQKSLISITNSLRELEGPNMTETMKDQIRQWFIECHDATGSFPDYPEEEDGGSAVIFADKTPEQLMEELAAKEEEEANKKPKGKEETKDKGKKEKAKGEEIISLSLCLITDVWQNRDESKNFNQRHEAELIKEEKRKEIEAEIRLQVDELMRQELANWKLAVDRDKGRKAKATAKKKKASKSGKKKKKDKDLTADSYLGTTLRQTDIEPMPSLSDVRQVIALYAVLPLGSQVVHEKAPLVKAILLVGPSGVGKKMLVHAICHETGANLFDLSPLNLVEKYPGKSGLQMMLHLVFKVARLIQPSVVWIGDAEKMFYKKVPKEEKELDPKRLKKDLPKILKSMKGEDRVLIVGTTSNPLSADLKSLCKLYTKIILIPRPDYASRYIMWKQLIQRNGGVVTSALDLSSLAKISDGYTQGQMVRVVQGILTERRIQQLAKRPLVSAEFVAHLARTDPVFQDEEEALKAWYAKTPLGRKRVKAASGKDEEEAPAKGGKDAKKGKK
uniref:AAA+ ATPase domain-containing protein n=1 Tax=Pygocentrus nattereri TaxID=42514 RepID=A0AAR2M1E6_PYGNA